MTSNYSFGDDRAKSNPWRDDQLGVAPLAERLAKVIFSLDAPYGYVIGVNGVWGSGKSTLLNFTAAYLDKFSQEATDTSEAITPIDFRPWMVSGHRDLVAAFLKVLSESLGPRDHWLKRKSRRIVKRFRGSSDSILDAVATVAVAADIGVTQGAATGVVKALRRPLKDKIDSFLEEPSLQAAHQSLVEQLKQTKKRFFVMIDDIDRLTEEEILAIMQMVKTVGQLPNVVYLLSYDKGKLWEAFKETGQTKGARFAEKIIQHEIELPKPSKPSLITILDKELAFIKDFNPDAHRWHSILMNGIQRWIVKPRDVLLLSNAAKFSWPALEGEMDPADLLAMEGLRVFDMVPYQWIRDNREFLFREGEFMFIEKDARQRYFDRFTNELDHHPAKGQILDLLGTLFPSVSELTKTPGFAYQESYSSTSVRRGIATKAGYEAYFALSLSANAISKRTIDDAVSGLRNEQQVSELLASFIGKKDGSGAPMVSSFIAELHYRFEDGHPVPATVELFFSLFSQSEKILLEPRPPSMFQLAPHDALRLLILKMLRNVGATHALALLKTAFERCPSVAFCADVYVHIGQELGVIKSEASNRHTPPIDRSGFDELGPILLGRIEEAVSDGTLRQAPYFYGILTAWEHLAGNDSPQRWVGRQMMEDAVVAIKMFRGFVGYSMTSNNKKDYVFSERPDPARYDLDVIRAAVDLHLQKANLNEDERRLLDTVKEGAKRFETSTGDSTDAEK